MRCISVLLSFYRARVGSLSGIYDVILFGKRSKSRAFPVFIFESIFIKNVSFSNKKLD